MTEEQILSRYGPVVAVMESRSALGKKYEVRRAPGGSYSCQCSAWRFRKTCRHVEYAAANGLVAVKEDPVEELIRTTLEGFPLSGNGKDAFIKLLAERVNGMFEDYKQCGPKADVKPKAAVRLIFLD